MLSRTVIVLYQSTLQYSSWSNGAIESLYKMLLHTFRALVSELRIQIEALNNVPSLQPKNIAHITVHRNETVSIFFKFYLYR